MTLYGIRKKRDVLCKQKTHDERLEEETTFKERELSSDVCLQELSVWIVVTIVECFMKRDFCIDPTNILDAYWNSTSKESTRFLELNK